MTRAGVVERNESTEATAVAPGTVHYVSSHVVRSVLSWPDVIDRIRTAYELPHANAASPRRVVARNDGAWLRALAAAPPGGRFMGAKVFGVGRRRRVNYLITLFEQETGEIRGLVDAALITAFRTAATSGVAVDRLAPARPLRVAVLGSGLEAHSHVRAVAAVRALTELRVFSPTPARREAFVATFESE